MSISRRELIGGAAVVGAGALLGIETRPARAAQARTVASGAGSAATQPAAFSFVHLTDMHVTTKRHGHEGYRACVADVLRCAARPAFAVMGGDLAFDGLYTPKAEFEAQIRLYQEITAELGMPAYPCMGNHDVLGWSSRRKVVTDDPDLGKKLILERLAWEKPYYSFDHGGWHFAVLDSIYPIETENGPGYEPRIGPEQLEWLAYDLGAAGDRPKVCVTHIAAFCALAQYNGDPQRKALDGSMVLQDTKALREVLERHGVKALLQGHSHKIEQYNFRGVWYLTSAAVSGAWWAGDWIGEAPGYTLLHCRGDELTWEHRSFVWEPQLEPDDTLERQKLREWHTYQAEQGALRARERAGRK